MKSKFLAAAAQEARRKQPSPTGTPMWGPDTHPSLFFPLIPGAPALKPPPPPAVSWSLQCDFSPSHLK